MSFNGSFGDADFVNDENPNNISLGQEDIKINLSCGNNTQEKSDTKCFINNEISIPTYSNNNIFSSVPMELEEDNNIKNIEENKNNIYMELLAKELLRYHLGNLFHILSGKKTIIKTNIFYSLKKMYKNKLNNLIKAQILFLRISSSLNILKSIIQSRRANFFYQIFYKIKRKYNYIKDIQSKDKNNFRARFELNYSKEKNNLINQNNISIKSLQKDIQEIKKNINQLTKKESELKTEINSYFQEEKQLNEKIKSIESKNTSIKKSNQASNSSTIKTITNSEILSLESALNANQNLKKEKEQIINAFMKKVNNLLNEYQVYIDNLNTLDLSGSNNNINNNMNIELTTSTNLQSLKIKDTTENSLFASKFSVKNQSNES